MKTPSTTVSELAALLVESKTARKQAIDATHKADIAETVYQIAAATAHYQREAYERMALEGHWDADT